MELTPILPDDHADTASRKRKERASRQANGERRVEVWLPEHELGALDAMADAWGVGRSGAVMRLIYGLKPR